MWETAACPRGSVFAEHKVAPFRTPATDKTQHPATSVLSIRSEGLTVRWNVLNEVPATIVAVNPLEQFAANLRRCRRNRGLSQQRLAFNCKLHRTEVSLLERGDRNPRLTTIVRLARALGVAPAELLEDVA